MKLQAHIISTTGKRLHSFSAITPTEGLNRAIICLAEQEAKDWARDYGHKVVSDIVSQGQYRAWVEPIPAGRLRTMAQLRTAA